MKRLRLRSAVLVCALLNLLASPAGRCGEWIPSGKELFPLIFADPLELSYALRLTTPVGKKNLAEINLGDYLGIYRWSLGEDRLLQVGLGGGVGGRFDISRASNDFQVADFTAAVPLDLALGKNNTVRFAYWHVSSHIGDDYIRTEAPAISKHFTDEMRLVWSFIPARFLRLCAGGSHAFKMLPPAKSNSLEASVELRSPVFRNGSAQVLFGTGIRAPQRNGWKPSSTTKLGVKATDAQRVGALTLYVEYFSGRLLYQQFGDRKESHWTLGLALEIGNPVLR